MLTNVDSQHAKVRIGGIDAQIKELREQIKRLEKKKAIYKNALSNSPSPDETPAED